jgi:NitT/TauT family transport system substrate-binding protein
MPARAALALALAAALLPAACGGSRDGAEGGLRTIRISGSPSPLFIGPIYIAEAEGYFAEQGLRTEILIIPGSTSEAVPALASGSLDVLTGRTNIGVFNAMAQGAPIRIVASQGMLVSGTCPSDGLVIRGSLVENGVLPPLDSLRGRRIAVNRNTLDGFYLDALLARAGLSIDDVETIIIPNASILDALTRGAIDYATVPEPYISSFAPTGHILYAAANDIAPGLQTRSIIFGPTLLRERPDDGRRFLIAYLKGLRRFHEGKTERNLDILDRGKYGRDVLQRACWPSTPEDGHVEIASLVEFQEWAQRRGLLDRVARPDEMWEPRFLEEASAALAADEEASR